MNKPRDCNTDFLNDVEFELTEKTSKVDIVLFGYVGPIMIAIVVLSFIINNLKTS